MTDDTKQFVKEAIAGTHWDRWGLAYAKYFSLLALGLSPVMVGFFNGQSFEWQDWAILFSKIIGVWGAVTAAFVDQTYGKTKDKTDT